MNLIVEKIRKNNAFKIAIACLACRQVHLVNPATGKVLGEGDE